MSSWTATIVEQDKTPFEDSEEEAIVSLVLEHPDFYSSVGHYITPDLFQRADARYVMGVVCELFQKYESLPPKKIVADAVLKTLTVDSDYEPIKKLLKRRCDPREVQHVRDMIRDWAKDKAYEKLFTDGAEAFADRDYTEIDQLLEKAQRITDPSGEELWFFESLDLIFHKDLKDHFSTGFHELDMYINADQNGIGPSRKEVLCWMAATGVGKSTILCNNGVQGIIDGHKVLHVTLELSKEQTMLRYAGAITGIPIKQRMDHRDKVEQRLAAFRRSARDGNMVIKEYPANSISVNEIHQTIDHLKKSKGWQPDIVIVDYLELMLSKRESTNDRDEYIRQKMVGTEMRGFAQKEDVLVYTAVQTNRSGAKKEGNEPNAGLENVAESYGKLMPLDYVISGNQTEDEYKENKARLYIVKNRNGPKNKTIPVLINYETQKVRVDKNMGVEI
jgi:replicative DNA helicase